jgi:hypothetical protein
MKYALNYMDSYITRTELNTILGELKSGTYAVIPSDNFMLKVSKEDSVRITFSCYQNYNSETQKTNIRLTNDDRRKFIRLAHELDSKKKGKGELAIKFDTSLPELKKQ